MQMHSSPSINQILHKIRSEEWDEVERLMRREMCIGTDAAYSIAKQLQLVGRLDLISTVLLDGRVALKSLLERIKAIGDTALLAACLHDPPIKSLLSKSEVQDIIEHLIKAGQTFEPSFIEKVDLFYPFSIAWTAARYRNASVLVPLLQQGRISFDERAWNVMVQAVTRWGNADILELVLQYPGTKQYAIAVQELSLKALNDPPNLPLLRLMVSERRFQLVGMDMGAFVTEDSDPAVLSILLDRFDLTEAYALNVRSAFMAMAMRNGRFAEVVEVLMAKSQCFRLVIARPDTYDLIETLLDRPRPALIRLEAVTLLVKYGHLNDTQHQWRAFELAIHYKRQDLLRFTLPYNLKDSSLLVGIGSALGNKNHEALYAILEARPSIIQLLNEQDVQTFPLDAILPLLAYKPIRNAILDAFPADHAVLRIVHQRENMIDHFDHDFTEVPPGINHWLPDGGPRFLESFIEMFPDSAPPSSYLNTKIEKKIYKYKAH